jgi:hypothetical protein
MCSILAFDSASMDCLLSDKNKKYFNKKYPIIYKNKIPKKWGDELYYYSNAIDNALKNNQIKAVNMCIDYIVKFQNNFVSSYIFTKNMPVIMSKGISISHLLASNVFCVVFDYDDWPSSHFNDIQCIRPYDGSFFNLRHKYKELFPEEQFLSLEEIQINGELGMVDVTQIKQIKYTINLLIQTGFYIEDIHQHGGKSKQQNVNEEISFMEICADTEELEIF